VGGGFLGITDGSVTRSALEEYVGIKMQESSMVGQFSIGGLRSRYNGGGSSSSKPS
jgi:hypothetical protein